MLVPAEHLTSRLRARIDGDVAFDPGARAAYAHDGSNYRRVPIGVVAPRTKDDVIRTIAECRAANVPVVSRGGGTALAGQTVNEAVVIDHSRHLKRMTLDPARKRARVELGVVCDQLTDATLKFGLTFGPKPATHSRCCFGGMIANNCGGRQAQMNGTAVDNVESLDVVLYDGTRLTLGWLTEEEWAEKARTCRIHAGLRDIRDRYAERIRRGYPKLPRRISGYNLDRLLPDDDGRVNLSRIIVGSEGTLATMLEAELILLKQPKFTANVVLGFRDVFEAGDAAHLFAELRPLSVEGMDEALNEHIRKKGGENAEHIKLLPEGSGWLIVEVGGDTEYEARLEADRVLDRAAGRFVSSKVLMDEKEQQMLTDAREGGLGATAFVPGEPDGWEGWEDSAVPTEELGNYLRDLRKLYDKYGYRTPLYGHFGMGLVHCRVTFDLPSESGVTAYRQFLDEASSLVVSYGGSLSGEHGDGQSRAELLGKMFGPELMQAMREVKYLFDPDGKMNPGKVVDPYPITSGLKLYPRKFDATIETHFRYPDDGGSMERATLRCVGVGLCRREKAQGHHDTMCPSYMVTHDEKHTTRGRARLLWEMIRADGPINHGWQDEAVKEALDLCLACKGCKGDCPVNVDIATHKAEFFSHYYESRLRPRHAYAFGFIDVWARLGALAPGLANLTTQLPGLRAFAKWVAGISQSAEIPPFAPRTFRSTFVRRRTSGEQVLLFADTFNDHFHPDTLHAAVRVLEDAGFSVDVPAGRVCCGRPLYDFGMLDRARSYLENMLTVLAPSIAAGTPIVFLEPSCASVIKDELHNLLPEREDAARLAKQTMLLSEFLVKRNVELPRRAERAIVQGHCHHKSVLDFGSEREALKRAGVEAEILEAGCCGMAGAFGFVSETRPVGRAAGERVLLPRVRKERKDTLVVADGFSCREQIRQGTDRTALHLAEVLAGESEAAIVRRRRTAVRGTMLRAGLGIAAVVALLAWWRRAR